MSDVNQDTIDALREFAEFVSQPDVQAMSASEGLEHIAQSFRVTRIPRRSLDYSSGYDIEKTEAAISEAAKEGWFVFMGDGSEPKGDMEYRVLYLSGSAWCERNWNGRFDESRCGTLYCRRPKQLEAAAEETLEARLQRESEEAGYLFLGRITEWPEDACDVQLSHAETWVDSVSWSEDHAPDPDLYYRCKLVVGSPSWLDAIEPEAVQLEGVQWCVTRGSHEEPREIVMVGPNMFNEHGVYCFIDFGNGETYCADGLWEVEEVAHYDIIKVLRPATADEIVRKVSGKDVQYTE